MKITLSHFYKDLIDFLYGSINFLSLCNTDMKYEINEKYLPEVFHNYIQTNNAYVLFIRSPMGSGKTRQLKHVIYNYIQRYKNVGKTFKVLVISSRRTYTTYFCKNLPNFHDYRKVKKPYSCLKYPKLVVQLQSLSHFEGIDSTFSSLKDYNLIILDEIQTLCTEIHSSLFSIAKKVIYSKILYDILLNIPKCICMDANLSHTHVNWVAGIRKKRLCNDISICLNNRFAPQDHLLEVYEYCSLCKYLYVSFKRLIKTEFGKKYQCIYNTDFIQEKVCVNTELSDFFISLYAKWAENIRDKNLSDIMTALTTDLKKGNKISVVVSTVQQGKLLARFLSEYYQCKVLFLYRDCEDGEQVISNINTHIRKFDVLIITTFVQIGIDICPDFEYFHSQYAIIEISRHCPGISSIYQAIGRVRHTKTNTLKIVFLNRTLINVTNEQKIREIFNNDIVINNLWNGRKISLYQDIDKMVAIEHELKSNFKGFVMLFLFLLKGKYTIEETERCFAISDKELTHAASQQILLTFKKEIFQFLNSQINRIWKKLERESDCVPNVLYFFTTFLKRPTHYTSDEQLFYLLKFANTHLGFLYVCIFSESFQKLKEETIKPVIFLNQLDQVEYNNTLLCAFLEDGINYFFRKDQNITVFDIMQLKNLIMSFIEKLAVDLETVYFSISTIDYYRFVEQFQMNIKNLALKFLGETMLTKSSNDIDFMFRNLLKFLYVNVPIQKRKEENRLLIKCETLFIFLDLFDPSELLLYLIRYEAFRY